MIRLEKIMFQGLFSQTLTNLGELEGDYRAFHLKNDIAQSILALIIASIGVLGMLRLDFLLYKDRPDLFMLLALGRIGFVVVTILFILVIRRTTKVRTFDRLIMGWAFFIILFLLLMNFTRPVNQPITPFDIIVPFAIYMLSPLRIADNALLALAFSVGTLYVNYSFKPGVDPVSLNAAAAAQVLVHVLGLGSSWQLHSYRRRSFKAYMDEKDAREMVAYLANIDPLTKSLTRRHFFNIAES